MNPRIICEQVHIAPVCTIFAKNETDMTLQQMQYITAVSRLRHFARAAKECGVTQPTLSAMIRKLEEELGVTLFERSSQLVEPTPTGQLVIEEAQAMLDCERRIRDIIAEQQHSLRGTFRLGILPTIAPYLLPRVMPWLGRKFPELNLHVTEMKTGDIKEALTRGEIDAAVAVSVSGLDGFNQTRLYYEQFVAYVSRESPLFSNRHIVVSDIRNESLWLLDEGHCFRDQLVKFCQLKAADKSKSNYLLGSIETFMRMVESGNGITFIPELALEQLSPQQKELARPFGLPIPVREVVMLTTEKFIRKAVQDTITDAIVTHVPERMLRLNNTEQRI